MSQTSATNQQLETLKEQATSVGFTPEGLYVMLVMIGLEETKLTVEDIRNVWPYVNEINAKKFSQLGDVYGREKIEADRRFVAENGRQGAVHERCP